MIRFFLRGAFLSICPSAGLRSDHFFGLFSARLPCFPGILTSTSHGGFTSWLLFLISRLTGEWGELMRVPPV